MTDNVCLDALLKTQFAALVFEQEIPHTAQSKWGHSSNSLDPILEYALATSRSTGTQSALLDLAALFGERSLALVTLKGDTAYCRTAGAERAIVVDIERWLHDCLPEARPTKNREIPIRFWTCGAHGANSISRT
ncbi:MAG: hypothetical protein WB998_04405, partial [Solirubrobacteraceae bacterium]